MLNLDKYFIEKFLLTMLLHDLPRQDEWKLLAKRLPYFVAPSIRSACPLLMGVLREGQFL